MKKKNKKNYWNVSTAVPAKGTALTIDNLNKYEDCGEKECIFEETFCYKHTKEALENASGYEKEKKQTG